MRELKPCTVCEKMTDRFLFKDQRLGIPVCSRRCEYEFIENITLDEKEQAIVVSYLDGKIVETKKRNRIGWGVSGFGVALIISAFVIADAMSFIVGNVVVVFGTLSTRHFEDKIEKLTRTRKRIVI